MSDELITAENVSKKFCKSLRRSLWYGANDVLHSLNPWSHSQDKADLSHPVDQTSLRRDEFWALRNLSFGVRRGECLGLIGHNGAGKSTLLKILNGLVRPDRGRITMRGRIAAMIELNAGFNYLLTGRENIYTQASLLGFSNTEIKRRFDAIVAFSELENFLDMPVQNYSSGMKVKLGFAVYSQLEPDVLIIDEVLAVGDVAFRLKCLNAIGAMMKSAAVIFVSHSLPQIFRVCSQLLVLEKGVAVYAGRNLQEGAARYLEILDFSEVATGGSGDVVVRALRLSGDGEQKVGSTQFDAPHGGQVEFFVELENTSGLKSARVEVLLWNTETIPVMEVMTETLSGYEFKFDAEGKARVTALINRMELGPGKYMITVVVTNTDHSLVYCRYDNLACLNIVAATPSGAITLPIATWSERE